MGNNVFKPVLKFFCTLSAKKAREKESPIFFAVEETIERCIEYMQDYSEIDIDYEVLRGIVEEITSQDLPEEYALSAFISKRSNGDSHEQAIHFSAVKVFLSPLVAQDTFNLSGEFRCFFVFGVDCSDGFISHLFNRIDYRGTKYVCRHTSSPVIYKDRSQKRLANIFDVDADLMAGRNFSNEARGYMDDFEGSGKSFASCFGINLQTRYGKIVSIVDGKEEKETQVAFAQFPTSNGTDGFIRYAEYKDSNDHVLYSDKKSSY